MSQRKKLQDRVMRGDIRGISLADLCLFLEHCGFKKRQRGTSHLKYYHDKAPDLINLQDRGDGKAKSYQVLQVRGIINNHGLLPLHD